MEKADDDQQSSNMEEAEDESFIGVYYEYLVVAGELNPFTIIEISQVRVLTTDVGIAYNQALRHVQNQGSPSLVLPPTREPQVRTASQVKAA